MTGAKLFELFLLAIIYLLYKEFKKGEKMWTFQVVIWKTPGNYELNLLCQLNLKNKLKWSAKIERDKLSNKRTIKNKKVRAIEKETKLLSVPNTKYSPRGPIILCYSVCIVSIVLSMICMIAQLYLEKHITS